MKITGFNVYQVDLPLKEGAYNWSDGKSVSVFDTTIVEILTDAGISGVGEVCPLGSSYLPSYANGVRCGLKELCGSLVGCDPTEIGVMNSLMDYQLKGHPYVKSPIDMACWDILGKKAGLPVCTLLGGRFGESVQLYRAISRQPAMVMAENVRQYMEEGYDRFQLKVGGKLEEDIARIRAVRSVLKPHQCLVADANTGWLSHEAITIANAVKDLDVYIEQPCATYDECHRVRKHTNLPFVLDEVVHDVDSLIKAHHDNAADIVNLKISKFGGLTKIKQARDLCVSIGLPMCLEDTWGSDIVTSAIVHLAHSTPEKFRFSSTDFNSYNSVSVANGAPERKNGRVTATNKPGLGVELRQSVVGKPIFSI
eukprot:gene14318-15807_t